MLGAMEENEDTIVEQFLNNMPRRLCSIPLHHPFRHVHRIAIVPVNCAIASAQSLAVGTVEAI